MFDTPVLRPCAASGAWVSQGRASTGGGQACNFNPPTFHGLIAADGEPDGLPSQVHGLREAVAAVRAAGKRVIVACPRVLKPGEDGLAGFYLRLGADALLLRSAGLLYRLSRADGPGAPTSS